jgi:hypothetical protein
MEVAVLDTPAAISGRDQHDELHAAAKRLNLRILPSQRARITWDELESRLTRRRKQDNCPSGEVLRLKECIARLKRELEQAEERLKPRMIPVAPARPKDGHSRNYWACNQEEYAARQALCARRRELPGLIYEMEKELEAASRVSKPEQHLRKLLHIEKHFREEPRTFDLKLQELLPQLKKDEQLVVLAEVLVEGTAAQELYGSPNPCIDCRMFLVSTAAEFQRIRHRASKKRVLFCALDPRSLVL